MHASWFTEVSRRSQGKETACARATAFQLAKLLCVDQTRDLPNLPGRQPPLPVFTREASANEHDVVGIEHTWVDTSGDIFRM